MSRVFISYSHKDEEWKDRLVSHLGGLQQMGYLDLWDDRRIKGGDDWFREIEEAINTANIAILLISANFTSSKFISTEEIPRLLQRRQKDSIKIFPIIIKPCDWQGIDWLAALQARPKDARPLSTGDDNQINADLAAIAKEIRELLQRAGVPREKVEYVPLPPDQLSLAKLPTTQHALFGREQELQRLDDAWANPHCHVLRLVAFGGVGKTALVNEWLNRLGADNWRGAERIYGWSFYSQGTREDKQASADTFFEETLRFFGWLGDLPKAPWDKGKLLASLIKERKTLLILDGLEPLQYPPGEMEGCLRDQGVQALLKELARLNNGLCVITSRCKVADIEATAGQTTHQIDLENLSPVAGMQVLRETGVTRGTDKELQQAAEEYDGHALALTLLGRYLAIRYEGEIRKRDTVNKLATEKTRQGMHARHVMDSYELWLDGTPELDLLYIMGLFDRPAPLGAIDALKQEPAIKGLTEALQKLTDEAWDFTLSHLRDLRLLAAGNKETLDCHPLIREHFAEKLKAKSQQAWQEAHSRLYDYYKNLPEKELPDTLEEMEPLFAAVAHGCQAGKHQECLDDIYYNRVRRENDNYICNKIGAFGADLAALANFFEDPWRQPAEKLTDADKAVVLSWAGFHLRALGRLREAAQPMQASIEMLIEKKDWKKAAAASGNLSELWLTNGEVPQAVEYARQSVEFADRSGDEFLKETARTWIANASHQAGELTEALTRFQEAEIMLRKRTPKYKYRYSQSGFQFCDLLLSQGKAPEVLERAKQTLEWAIEYQKQLLWIALDKLSLGRAYLLQAVLSAPETTQSLRGIPPQAGRRSNLLKQQEIASFRPALRDGTRNDELLQQAADYLNQAVAGLRESGRSDYVPLGLFARAFLFRLQNNFPGAWEDLAEAQEIAERGGMKLWLVDYHLEAARLYLAERVAETSHAVKTVHAVETLHATSLQKAADLVQETGYHRRDPEVELGFAGLFFAQGDHTAARQHLAKAKGLLEKMGIRQWDFEVKRLEQLVGGAS